MEKCKVHGLTRCLGDPTAPPHCAAGNAGDCRFGPVELVTVYVSIGRNIGASPMPQERWTAFQDDVWDTLIGLGTVFTVAEGDGVYEGQVERSAVAVAEIDKADLPILRDRLAHLAARYGQECIALAVVPQVEFVAAAAVATAAEGVA